MKKWVLTIVSGGCDPSNYISGFVSTEAVIISSCMASHFWIVLFSHAEKCIHTPHLILTEALEVWSPFNTTIRVILKKDSTWRCEELILEPGVALAGQQEAGGPPHLVSFPARPS